MSNLEATRARFIVTGILFLVILYVSVECLRYYANNHIQVKAEVEPAAFVITLNNNGVANVKVGKRDFILQTKNLNLETDVWKVKIESIVK